MPKIITSKEEILAIATEVFKEHGYPNTSIAMLAKACNIQKAHFYYYFENKEQLMAAVLRFVLKKTEEDLFLPAWDVRVDKSERLQLFLSSFEALFYKTGEGKIMVNTILQMIGMETPFVKIAQEFYTRLIETVAHLYEDRYSATYAINKAEQAVQDLQGALIMTQLYNDDRFLKGALKRVGKKV